MNTYKVYVRGCSNAPKFVIDADNERDAKERYLELTNSYPYLLNSVIVDLVEGVEIKETDYAYKLNKWRKDHKNKPWTGTLPPEKLDEDQFRFWFDCYMQHRNTEEIPIFAIEAMYNAIKG